MEINYAGHDNAYIKKIKDGFFDFFARKLLGYSHKLR